MKWSEGRVSLCGIRSAAWYSRQQRYLSTKTSNGLTPGSPYLDDDDTKKEKIDNDDSEQTAATHILGGL